MPRRDEHSWRVDPASGLLLGARQVPSPHQDARPPGAGVELVVIHGISLPPDDFGGPWIEDLFLGRLDPAAHPYFAAIQGPRVSAHLLLRRGGEVVQYVPFLRRAWHAGVSSWRGRERCNDFSVGIEVEGSEHRPYTDVQYRILAEVLAALAAAYPALAYPDRLTSHADVASERKSDPWETFDWRRLLALLGAQA